MSSFHDNSFLPADRTYDNNPITLGACSYVRRANFIDSKRPQHILIGRFSSVAENILFLIGRNHNYKNTVTTYPFDVTRVVEKIISAANIPRSDYIPQQKRYSNSYQIIIGNDVWIGRGATILGGVKIGSGAIIGANAMVAKNIPPYAIAVGNPARVIKYRFDEETIKKFLAVKWWNWDIKKIYENLPLMKNPEEFLKKHYSPELEKNFYEQIPIEKYLAEGRQIYSFVADFHAAQPLWRRVISGFCKFPSDNAIMFFYLNDANEDDIAALKIFVAKNKISNHKIIHCIPPTENKIFSPYLLKKSTHFITTREMISIECMDLLWDTDVKIVSALDEKIFDGEPDIDWEKIFIH